MGFDFNGNSTYVAIFLMTLLLYIHLHLTRNFKYWKNQNVPYMKPTFLFGNLFPVVTWQKMMGVFISDLYNSTKHPFIGFFCFDQPFLLIRDPEIIKHIFVKDFDSFSDRSIIENQRDDKYGSNILFTLKNPTWRLVRLKLTPIFASGKIKNMTHLIVDVGKTLTEYIEYQILKKNDIYVREVAMKYSTDVITSCAFGLSANSFKDENAEFRLASRRLFENTTLRASQAVSYFLAPVLVRLFRMTFLEPNSCAFMEKAFKETMSERKNNNKYRGDLIDLLLQLKNSGSDSENLLNDDIILSQAIQFFVAGFETTGSTIFYILHELSYDQSIQNRLRQEIHRVLKNDAEITYDLIQSMTYMNMVISEGLRKYPILTFLDRRCTRDFKIPNSDVVIKTGLPVYISLLGLHYDPKIFPNPQKFDPERFAPENMHKIPAFTYMPFGKGLHNCIGARFAVVGVKVALAALLAKYEVHPHEDNVYEMIFNPKSFLVAPLKDIKMHFKKSRYYDKNKNISL